MTPPKATAKKPTYSFGDFGEINGKFNGTKASKGSKGGAKTAPAKPKSTPVQNNEVSRSGIIMLGGLTIMSDKQRKKALNAGELPKWRPYVASSHVSGTYTPKGVKPLRPAAGAVPERATGSV
ncbi:MAG TPA: hypothetical protein VFW62_10700, partial [bacterium]|nr:hypothetical protein [bacterium]